MDVRTKNELTVQGISASQGIAYGQVFLYIQSDVEVSEYTVDADKRPAEVARFERSLLATRQQIQGIQDQVEKNLGHEEAMIFDAHLMVLEDRALISEVIREFETTGNNIEACFNRVSRRYIEAFAKIEDDYLRERAGDIRDVAQRVLQNLIGQAEHSLSQLADKRVVVANDVSPSDSASIDRSQAVAIVTETGSRTSHAVIVARSMKIPAVVGVREVTRTVRNGDWVLVDGYDGVIIINPSEHTLFRYGKIQFQKKSFEQRLLDANRQPAVTLDGVRVQLLANIERADETELVREYSADGVGLFRTEFLFLNSNRLPGEDAQLHAYRMVAESLSPAPVVIRTLDIGGDKPMAGAPDLFPKENNPFLGFRAIRFCLENIPIFKDQLRAILRSSAYGSVRLMYPMISGVEELQRANLILDECKAELRKAQVPFDEKMPVGSMIEIPSAAYTIDILAEHCDFVSIGTNDLIQYLLAIDRVNDRIAHLYEPTHPGVLRTLKHIVDGAHKQKIKVSVCGEMAGDPVFVPLLLGLGVDELSMTPPLLPAAKYIVRAMKLSDAKALAKEALTMREPKAIFMLAETFYRERMLME